MGTKLFSFNLKNELREQLEKTSKYKNWSMALVIEHALIDYFKKIDGYVFEENKEKPKNVDYKPTEEERITDWEWRKKMVAEGKFPRGMELEYPNTMTGDNKNTDEFIITN